METLKVKWKPIGARLILKKVNEYQGSIIVPATTKQASMVCEVVAAGFGCESDYQEGDLLMIARYSGYDLPVLDHTYSDCIICNEKDILCYGDE